MVPYLNPVILLLTDLIISPYDMGLYGTYLSYILGQGDMAGSLKVFLEGSGVLNR
jgi:hypothetical protein